MLAAAWRTVKTASAGLSLAAVRGECGDSGGIGRGSLRASGDFDCTLMDAQRLPAIACERSRQVFRHIEAVMNQAHAARHRSDIP
jgi:hypothetical protein